MPHDHILVVDDERDILELVKYNLDKEGYRVTAVATGEDALRGARRSCRTSSSSTSCCRASTASRSAAGSRATPRRAHIPIVMLTAKGSEADVVAGLELGAADYVTKPFSPRVLTGPRPGRAAPRASRRGRRRGDRSASGTSPSTPAGTRCSSATSPVELTATEFRILALPGPAPRLGVHAAADRRRRAGRRLLRQRPLRDRPLGRRAHRLAAPQARLLRRLHRDGARRRVPPAGRSDRA